MSSLARSTHPNRLSERFTSELYLCVYDESGEQHVGNLLDVSEGGVRLLCRERRQIGDVVAYQIGLPTADGDERVECRVQVRWAVQALNPSLFEVGCRFVSVAPGDVERVMRAVRAFNSLF